MRKATATERNGCEITKMFALSSLIEYSFLRWLGMCDVQLLILTYAFTIFYVLTFVGCYTYF